MLKRCIVIYVISLLTACGFHLRGMADIPAWLTQVSIVIEQAHHDLAGMLKDQLQAYNISLAASPAQANFLLIIENDAVRQQITSVSASTTPRQYQLFYTVNFKLIRRNGEVIIPETAVVISRQLTVNNNRILGSDAEELTIQKEMRRDAVLQILSRLNRKP